MTYPREMGFWITPRAFVTKNRPWSRFANTLLKLRKHAREGGASGDLTLHAPFGGGRASDTTLPRWFRSRVADRCMGGTSGVVEQGDVAQHPEMARWQAMLDPEGLGDIEGFIAAMRKAHRGGWSQLSVYVGSFRYLAYPQLMAVWPFIQSGAPIRRIIFDQSPPLRQVDREFLQTLAKVPVKLANGRTTKLRVGMEILRKGEKYPVPLDVCGTLPHLIRRANDPKSGMLVPAGKRTRILCMNLNEVKRAQKRGWRPLLYVTPRRMPEVFA